MLPVPADRLVEDGEALTVGECTLSVVHLEGHTPGSLALLWEGDPERPHLWSGDSLFPGGAGNTEQDAERFGRLMDDLERKVFGPLRTRRGSTPATARTRPSAPSGRACRSGARAGW
jgi:glyoxylase-like metal-dependent hydrolase (beta-lactamase superfamily II)